MDSTLFPWLDRKRPEVKRTYQSKFKSDLGPSRSESLLSRAIWAFDALWAPASTSAPISKSRTSGGSATSKSKDSEEMLVSFGRLSVSESLKDIESPPGVTLSPQTVCDEIISVSPVASSSSKRSLQLPASASCAFPHSVLLVVQECLDSTTILSTTSLVSKAWCASSRSVLSRRCVASLVEGVTVPKRVAHVHTGYPWGCFLSDGAFKQVFKVWNARCDRLEAVSVMDADAIIATGQEYVLHQEVSMGCLASDCVTTGQCANFVEIYSIFLADDRPDSTVWGSPDNRAPNGTLPVCVPKAAPKPKGRKGKAGKASRHVYIAMELCDGGSVEDTLRVMERDVLQQESGQVTGVDPFLHQIVPYMAQMSAALFTSSHRMHMLHGDVKLLNFMMVRNTSGRVRYDGGVFGIPKSWDCDVVVKLGDFGTACILAPSITEPITVSSFTTFENTPPEYLYGGDSVAKDFSADAWALGLCFLHVLTGNCPYEEVLESVVCPASLRKELYAVWSQPAFTTLSQALAVDDTHILPNTLYRMCVMLGVPTAEQLSEGGYDASPVWKVLVKGLCTPGKRGKPTAVRQQYDKDCARCSLAVGDHPLLVRARRRMAAIPNSQSLLQSLLNFFPQQRLSLSLLPRHAMFL